MIEILRAMFTYGMMIVAVLAVSYSIVDFASRLVKLYGPKRKEIESRDNKTNN
ncbi:MAG: hypothetical protein RBT45_08095 [Acholeplasmataceae bacterium]|nr:hypothetical protein [Acholeplasmataceae bacterium]